MNVTCAPTDPWVALTATRGNSVSTNGLDPAGVHEMRQLILPLAAIGKMVFLSSHILYEIQQVCNRVAILQMGRMLKQGDVQELLHEGKRLVVRLGTPEETAQAQMILQQASQHEMDWIAGVSVNTVRMCNYFHLMRKAGAADG